MSVSLLRWEDVYSLRFDDDYDALLSWLNLVGISIPVEILTDQCVGEAGIHIFINSCHRATNLKTAVGIRRIDQGDCNPWITKQIAVFLAGFACAQQDMGSIPVEQERAH